MTPRRERGMAEGGETEESRAMLKVDMAEDCVTYGLRIADIHDDVTRRWRCLACDTPFRTRKGLAYDGRHWSKGRTAAGASPGTPSQGV